MGFMCCVVVTLHPFIFIEYYTEKVLLTKRSHSLISRLGDDHSTVQIIVCFYKNCIGCTPGYNLFDDRKHSIMVN